MESILFLVHRIPFPPNKGDKVRSFHLLEFLSSRYRVHLGAFVDDPDDMQHSARVQEYCASSNIAELSPPLARLRSLRGLWTGEPLTLHYYRDAAMAAWVHATVFEQRITKAIVFSSPMAQYVTSIRDLRVIVDFVDVDSAKWTQYGESRRWPISMLFRREGERLLAFERAVATNVCANVFVTPDEADLFRQLAPECALRVFHARNGVDATYFSPQEDLSNPFGSNEEPIVFTGAMDYWPNVDAVCWFAKDVLPAIVAARPNARFYVVGAHPSPAVKALARDPCVVVTGRVPDVRPYLQSARVVVAPMRVARGIQNKVLEAMAMARPVIVSAAMAGSLSCVPGRDFLVADNAIDFCQKVIAIMAPQPAIVMGAAARARVLADYDWSTNLGPFEALLREPSMANCRAD